MMEEAGHTQIFTKEEKRALIPRLVKVFMAIPAVLVDGALVMLIGFLTAISTGTATVISVFSNDTTYKYVDAYVIFWTILILQIFSIIIGALAVSLVALQSYRNKTAAEYAMSKAKLLQQQQEKTV